MYTYWQQRRIFFQRTGGFFGAAGSARGLGTLLGWSNAGCPQPNMVQNRVIIGVELFMPSSSRKPDFAQFALSGWFTRGIPSSKFYAALALLCRPHVNLV
jgi:hypothetical protein